MDTLFGHVPPVESVWQYREQGAFPGLDQPDLLRMSQLDFKKDVYGDGIHGFIVLKNVLNSKYYSIFDLKCFLTEDYDRYKNFKDPDKLESGGMKNYLNFQGLSIVNPNAERVLYTKNYIKYDDLDIQRLMLEKMFSMNSIDRQIDKASVVKLKKKIKILKTILEKYKITFPSSSLLILYNSFTYKIKIKFLDFSYLPIKVQDVDLLGLDVTINMLDSILDQIPFKPNKVCKP